MSDLTVVLINCSGNLPSFEELNALSFRENFHLVLIDPELNYSVRLSDGEIERRLPKIAREIKKVIICPFGKNTE